jgi:hypothetical protein
MAKRKDSGPAGNQSALAGIFLSLPADRHIDIGDRLERFDEGQMSIDGITLLMQDLISAGALPLLPHKYTVAATHCAEQGLIAFNGRWLQ